MTPYVRKLLLRARKLNKVSKLTGSSEDKLKHHTARKEAKKAWKMAKTNFRNHLIKDFDSKPDQKNFWRVINNNLNPNTGYGQSIPSLS